MKLKPQRETQRAVVVGQPQLWPLSVPAVGRSVASWSSIQSSWFWWSLTPSGWAGGSFALSDFFRSETPLSASLFYLVSLLLWWTKWNNAPQKERKKIIAVLVTIIARWWNLGWGLGRLWKKGCVKWNHVKKKGKKGGGVQQKRCTRCQKKEVHLQRFSRKLSALRYSERKGWGGGGGGYKEKGK